MMIDIDELIEKIIRFPLEVWQKKQSCTHAKEKTQKIRIPCGDKCFPECRYPFCEVNRKKEEGIFLFLSFFELVHIRR